MVFLIRLVFSLNYLCFGNDPAGVIYRSICQDELAYIADQAVCALRLRCIVVASLQYGGENSRIRQILSEHSVKVRPFLFPFTIGKCNLIYSERVKVFFVHICRVFYVSQGQTRSLFFFVCNLKPNFKKVKFQRFGWLL